MAADRSRGEREERHDAAFAAVVRTQHEDHVLRRHHAHQDPENRRQPAEDAGIGERDAVLGIEGFLHGIERTRADVAVHHAKGEEGESGSRRFGGSHDARRLCSCRREGARRPISLCVLYAHGAYSGAMRWTGYAWALGATAACTAAGLAMRT